MSDLAPFLSPKSVAIIGASLTFGKAGNISVWNLVNLGYAGKVYPINPNIPQNRESKLYNMPMYRSLEDVQGEIDVALMAIPREAVVEAMENCAKKGIRAVVVLTGGLSDADEKGKGMERKLVEIARKSRMRIIGPNSQGVVNVKEKFALSFSPLKDITAGGVSFISQTGIFVAGAKFFAEKVHGLAKVIDLANMCDVDFADTLEHLAEDSETKVIAIHMEGLRKEQGRKLFSAAREVSKKKPIVVLKVGKSEKAARAITSHTGTLAGDDRVLEGSFRQSGIIRVADMDELLDVAKVFNLLPAIRGKKVGIITHTGGVGAIAVDACEEFGLEVVELETKTTRKVQELSPQWQTIKNPMDIWPACEEHGHRVAYEVAVNAALADANVDGILIIMPLFPGVFDCSEVIIDAAKKHKKPIAVWAMPVVIKGKSSREGVDKIYEMEREGIAVFSSPRKAIGALGAMWRYAEWEERNI
jgi:acetyltransferase